MTNTAKTVEIVKVTAPVVADNSVDITSCFYKTMFKNDPATLHFFNEANQAKGKQSQALADFIVKYASNIDNLTAIATEVKKVAHRHVALSVTAPLYPIVHKNLMIAIKETLGDTVTEDIGCAWGEAVSTLADTLIQEELELAATLEARTGGWRGEREFELCSKDTVAQDTVHFEFKSTDGYIGGFDFTPGQYLTIRIPELGVAPRHYTVTSRPGDAVLACTTRRVVKGVVSNYMHDTMKLGTKVLLGVPAGVFTATLSPSVLISAGIGVTPMWSFFNQLGKEHVKHIWAINPSASRALFQKEFEKSGIPTTYKVGGAKIDLKGEAATLVAGAGVGANYYVCGPNGFMVSFKAALCAAGVEGSNVHTEVFGTGNARSCPMVCDTGNARSCQVAH